MAKNIRQGFIALVLLLCVIAQVRAAEMWRNLETISGYDGYVSNVYTPSFQDNDYVRVGGWGDTYAGMIRFNVSTFPTTIYGASLWYYVTSNGGSSTTVPMTMYALSTPFGSNQYWLNGLYVYSASVKSIPQPQNGNWMVIDITDYYRNWKSGAWQNQGIILLPTATNNRFNLLSSANFSTPSNRKPFLLVSYTDAPAVQAPFLSFPLTCTTPLVNGSCPVPYSSGAYTPGKINSVVDHNMDTVYSHKDGKILSFTGEVFVATSVYPAGGITACYPKQSNAVWSATLQSLYKGTGQSGGGSTDCRVNKALNYEAHPGYDYVASSGTVVRSAAAGKVVSFNSDRCIPKGITCAGWGAVAIDHGNGYVTQYLHMDRIDVAVGQTVTEGMQLGISGTKAPGGIPPHLHFEVMKKVANSSPASVNDYKVVDPYGYDASTGVPDYLAGITGVVNVKLWK